MNFQEKNIFLGTAHTNVPSPKLERSNLGDLKAEKSKDPWHFSIKIDFLVWFLIQLAKYSTYGSFALWLFLLVT